ncbi:MAG TPA: EscU/YscU/HrcU family type III secretion system export apparatus switch protein [Polyangiales bacterium]|nr:EscU/YscU/HrcU family type III secretion system export apparatus switch protein [Polyangiales bacterium]
MARAVRQFGAPVSAALTTAWLFGALWLALPWLSAAFLRAEGSLWTQLTAAASAPVPVHHALSSLGELAFAAIGGVLGLAALSALATASQRGLAFRFAAGGGGPRIAPADTLRIALGWSLLAAALCWPLAAAVRGMLASYQRAPRELPGIAFELCVQLVGRAALALALLGVADLALQHWLFRRRLRLGRRELREERRRDEPDPHALAERRRRAHELLLAATLLELSELERVICEGTRRAIGVRAPGVVWLKAEGDLAARLRAEAQAAGLPIREDPALVDALLGYELNEPLPEQLRARLAEERA